LRFYTLAEVNSETGLINIFQIMTLDVSDAVSSSLGEIKGSYYYSTVE